MKSVQTAVEVPLLQHLPSLEQRPRHLHEAMHYAVLDGGKRVRPLLVFAAGAVFAAPPQELSRAAAAVEMIHAYSLVHDDMPCMDDDAFLRCKPHVPFQCETTTACLGGASFQATD